METKQNYEVIDWRLYDPNNSFFKSKASDKAEFRRSLCSNSKNCGLFAKGQCTLYSFGFQKCPYGYIKTDIGYSRKAHKYSDFIKQSKDSVVEIPQLDSANRKLSIVGDWVFFPYPHWYLKNNLPDEIKGGVFSSIHFIPINLFTLEFLYQIITFRPNAMMGGEIVSYQKEVVPKILIHLKEELPNIFNELMLKYEDLYIYVKEQSNIGRKALIKTLNKGCIITTDKGIFTWDGQHMICDDYKNVFNPFKGMSKIIIVPNDDETYKITDDNQVCSETKFLD